tara:strand:- start:6566 stop:7477 length:912 start_codon:yes stop_codon:yes gene_type:complete
MIKNQIKKLSGWSLYFFEKIFKNKKLNIFLFHEITDSPSEFQKKNSIFHSQKEFTSIINWISNNYKIISPNDIEKENSHCAIITFDDGYEGAFKYAIPYMIDRKIPSLHFLNMKPIINHEPNIVSKIEYLSLYSVNFKKFISKKNISNPIYEITPQIFDEYLKYNSIKNDEISKYQGNLVSSDTLEEYSDNEFVYYGNHLYDHWNIVNLSMQEIENYYFKNIELLKKYKNFIDIFSFTHGVPLKNFSKGNLDQIRSFKPSYVFYSSGGIKKYNDNTYDRTFLSLEDLNNKIFYFRKFRSNFIF